MKKIIYIQSFLIYVYTPLVMLTDSTFIQCEWNVSIIFIYVVGEYICELETYGDPIHQVNKLHVLGKIFS